nr:helix-turn-helix transcriptional regulator [uncultured Sphingomonas sp.]
MAYVIVGGCISARQIAQDNAALVSRLSPGQVDVLLLVNQHMNSKEIAAELGISPHTVDQRIRGALSKLGVDRRGEAAKIVGAAVSPESATYQRLIHQSPHIDEIPAPTDQGDAVSNQIRHADRVGEVEPSGFKTEQRSAGSRPLLQLPFATRNHPTNEMGVGQRLLWIILIAAGAAFSAGMYLAGLESLSRMISN